MAFDFFLNNSIRLTAIHFNQSFNRLMVEDSDEQIRTIELNEENFKEVTLWNGTRMGYSKFVEYIHSEHL